MDKIKKILSGAAAVLLGAAAGLLLSLRRKEPSLPAGESRRVKEEKEQEIEKTRAQDLVANSGRADSHDANVESLCAEFRERSGDKVGKLLQGGGA